MSIFRRLCYVGLILWGTAVYAESSFIRPSFWKVDAPIFSPGAPDSFDAIAVKDPSLVHFKKRWHLFYTARGPQGYSLGYAAARSLEDLQQANHYPLPQLGGQKEPYAAAPQIFYFKPTALWYLVYQTRDRNYQPVYSTNKNINNPANWTPPQPLCGKDESAKWIDFWVICDDTNAYLFYTRDHKDVWVRSTKLQHFPKKFTAARKVFKNVHEAVHLYKVQDKDEYHMIYELCADNGTRSFGLAITDQLPGPWKRVTDDYATGAMLRYPDDLSPWTLEVSHGEALRAGYDQRMEYQPDTPWLIQGLHPGEHQGNYAELPWKLGLIRPVWKDTIEDLTTRESPQAL